MSAVALDPHAEMSGLLREIAGPAGLVKARIRAAARALGWSYSRTKDLWYADPRTRVDPPELLQARATVSAFASTPVEMDLERLRSLESEVAELRALMAATLRRMEGASADPAQHLGAGSGPGPSGRTEGPRFLDRTVAEGA